MKFPFCVTRKKHSASFRIVSLLLAIAPLWLALATATTSAHAQTQPSPGDWTQFLRDNMQRWNPYETILGVNNVGGLKVKWSFAGNSSPLSGGLFSSPAVVNGVVYFGSIDSNVYALNASTGVKLWAFATGSYVVSSPAVANGVVYINSGDGNLYALNATTGAKLRSAGGIEGTAPVVANGVVYVPSRPFSLSALNASTGATLWSSSVGSGVSSSVAVANGAVYFGSPDHNVYALNAATGVKLWNFATGSNVEFTPAVANGVVYIGSDDGNLYALNATTGAELWSYAIGEMFGGFSAPAVANGVVYFGSGGTFCALNASTGAKLWSFATEILEIIDNSSPAVANGVVYIGSSNLINDEGNVYALNASTGAKLFSYNTGSDVLSSPAVVDGVVYVDSFGLGSGLVLAFGLGPVPAADLFLRIQPTPTTVHQGDLLTYAFPVWNLGPATADFEVLNTQVPEGTTFDYIRISGTPGLGTCTTPRYGGTGQIVCHENAAMAPNTTWTVRLTVKVAAAKGTVITENAATLSDTFDPNLANNMATVSVNVQ
jgi:outer membrane protein assembly factor BamB